MAASFEIPVRLSPIRQVAQERVTCTDARRRAVARRALGSSLQSRGLRSFATVGVAAGTVPLSALPHLLVTFLPKSADRTRSSFTFLPTPTTSPYCNLPPGALACAGGAFSGSF